MGTFHGQQKVEITHHEKSDKPLYGSLIAKSKKIPSSRGLNFVFSLVTKMKKTYYPDLAIAPFNPSYRI